MPRRQVHNKNNIGPQVRSLRFLRGWSQSSFATKLQLAGLDIDRSGVSKIEARMVFVDDRTLLYLADVLKVELAELFPKREAGRRIHEFMAQLETTRF
jgi:transcriptional regulator with XRE-family HTH domain